MPAGAPSAALTKVEDAGLSSIGGCNLRATREIRAVLFDFGGTLDYPQHWLDRFLRQYIAAGVMISRQCLDSAYSAATQTAYSCSEVRRSGLAELVGYLVRRQLEYLREDLCTPHAARELIKEKTEPLASAITDGFVAESIVGLERSRRVLSALPRYLRLGVISNFYGNLDRVLNEARLGELIDVVADSGRLGVYKPDLRLYEAALRLLKLAPEAVAMVGDSLIKDCAPARKLGMHTVWLRTSDYQTDTDGLADVTVGSLEELRLLQW
jgi:FMN phosphatase YigB (HAD superfamily)